MHIIDAGAESPWLAGGRVGQTGEAEAGFQIGNRLVGNPKYECLGCHHQYPLYFSWAEMRQSRRASLPNAIQLAAARFNLNGAALHAALLLALHGVVSRVLVQFGETREVEAGIDE